MKNNYYIDYLDYATVPSQNVNRQLLRFRFDLLLFADQNLYMSVPSCVKLQSTTDILVQIDDYWRNSVIKLQLDKKHKKSPRRYFTNRMQKLEKSIPEEKLMEHFEFSAYRNSRTANFYSGYIQAVFPNGKAKDVFVDKLHDTDRLFRTSVQSNIERFSGSNYDLISKYIDLMDLIKLQGMLNDVYTAAEKASFFQRAIILESQQDKYQPGNAVMLLMEDILDKSFAYANAKTNDAYPITFIMNQLTGVWMIDLLKRVYPQIYSSICRMPWCYLYSLANTSEWIEFKTYINAMIFLLQQPYRENDLTGKKYIDNIENDTEKVIHSVQLYRLISILKEKFVSKMRDSLKQTGAFYEAYTFSEQVEQVVKSLSMRYDQKWLYILYMIEHLAKILPRRIEAIESEYDVNIMAQKQIEKKIMLRDIP